MKKEYCNFTTYKENILLIKLVQHQFGLKIILNISNLKNKQYLREFRKKD